MAAHNPGVAEDTLSQDHLDTVPYYNLTQCQFCYSNKGEGVKLKICTGCKVYVYCSILCQKMAWKANHKTECEYIEARTPRSDHNTPGPSLGRAQLCFAAMRAFTGIHETALTNAALGALDVDRDPERCYRDVLVIDLKLNPKPTVVARMFEVTDARVCSAEELDLRSKEAFGQLRSIVQNRTGGLIGAYLATHVAGVFLRNTVWMVDHISPVIFSVHRPRRHTCFDWKQELIQNINEGLVVY